MPIPLLEQANLYRQLAALSNSGFTTSEALSFLKEEQHSPRVRRSFNVLAERAWGGVPLSQLLASQKGLLPADHNAVIAIGETTGLLQVVYKWLSDMAQRDWLLIDKVQRELRFPKITFLFALPAAIVLATIEFHSGLYLLVIALIALIAGFIFVLLAEYLLYRVNGTNSVILDGILYRLPFFRRTAMEMAQARFAHGVEALYAGGAPISETLRLAARACGNSILCRRVIDAIPGIDAGGSLVDELSRAKAIPPFVQTMITTGEETGKIDKIMKSVADYYEAETALRMHQFAYSLGMFALLDVGIMVGIVYIESMRGLAGAG